MSDPPCSEGQNRKMKDCSECPALKTCKEKGIEAGKQELTYTCPDLLTCKEATSKKAFDRYCKKKNTPYHDSYGYMGYPSCGYYSLNHTEKKYPKQWLGKVKKK